MSDLNELFIKYGTDKQKGPHGWGYTPYYENHLKQRRSEVRNVLEIGICGYRDIPNNVVGASLFAWRDYFPNALIDGVDNDLRFVFNDQQRIRTTFCDAYVADQMRDAIFNHFFNCEYDFIVDDCVHDPIPQLHLINILWPFLKVGGTYAIEEVCPYKLPNGDARVLVDLAASMTPHSEVNLYQADNKPECLLVLTKRS